MLEQINGESVSLMLRIIVIVANPGIRNRSDANGFLLTSE